MKLPWKSAFIVVISSLVLSGCQLPWAKQAKSGLQVDTGSQTATVFLDNEEKGNTPFNQTELKPGSYILKLQPSDSQLSAYETTVTLYPETLSVVNWKFAATEEESSGMILELEPLQKKNSTHLSVRSLPDGAIVHVNDQPQGFTPILLKSVQPGAQRFTLKLPGYLDVSQQVQAVEGHQMNVLVKLARTEALTADVLGASDSAEASEEAKASPSATPKPGAKVASGTPTPKATSKASPTPTVTKKAGATTTPVAGTGSGSVTIQETGTGWLRVRETASASGKELAKVDVGTTFDVIEEKSGWYKIEYEAGKEGWISSTYAKKN